MNMEKNNRFKRKRGKYQSKRWRKKPKRAIFEPIEMKPDEESLKVVADKPLELQINTLYKKKITIIIRNTELILNKLENRKAKSDKLYHADDSYEHIYRPDLCYHALLNILDSPLNKHNLIKIFLDNVDGKLIYVNPKFRIPRTWKVFMKIMAGFLSDSEGLLKTSDNNEILLKLLNPPMESHIYKEDCEENNKKIHSILSVSSEEKLTNLRTIKKDLFESNSFLVFTIKLPTSTKYQGSQIKAGTIIHRAAR